MAASTLPRRDSRGKASRQSLRTANSPSKLDVQSVVGDPVGACVGSIVGAVLGSAVGVVDGAPDGTTVGAAVVAVVVAVRVELVTVAGSVDSGIGVAGSVSVAAVSVAVVEVVARLHTFPNWFRTNSRAPGVAIAPRSVPAERPTDCKTHRSPSRTLKLRHTSPSRTHLAAHVASVSGCLTSSCAWPAPLSSQPSRRENAAGARAVHAWKSV